MTNKLETFFQYFPCSDLLRKWGFYALSAGWSSIPPGHNYPPVAHPENHHFSWEKGRVLDSYTFVYIPRGKGSLETSKTKSIPINEGSVFIIFPHIRHRYRPLTDTGWDEYWIEFAGAAADNFIKNSPLRPQEPVLTVQNTAKITGIFLDIIDTARQQAHGFEYQLASQAFSLLTAMISESDASNIEDKEKAEIIRKARQTLLSDLDKDIDLKELSAELGMSYSLFRKTFRTITGCSPHQYRLNFRLHRAEQMLKSSDLQVSQVAKLLGFSSIYYFSELFKKKTGSSPVEFRSLHTGK